MASWSQFSAEAPELASAVRERFDAHRHKTMATLRANGSPRISGTEAPIRDGQMWLGAMPDSVKARDLRRDPRMAVHSGSDEPADWRGDAKVSGVAVEITDEEQLRAFAAGERESPPGAFHLFRVDLTEVVLVSLGQPADHLVIESWHEGRGVKRVTRS